MGAKDCCATLWAIILPPIGVLLVRGCGCQLLLNILLTLLGYIPGVIHALLIVCATPPEAPAPAAAPQPQQIIVHAPVQPQPVPVAPAGYAPPPTGYAPPPPGYAPAPAAGPYPAVPAAGAYPPAAPPPNAYPPVPPAGYPTQ